MAELIAKTYGQAFFDVAREGEKSQELCQQLQQVLEIMQANPAYFQIMTTPRISGQEKKALLEDSMGQQLDPLVLNFLKVLVDQRRFDQLFAIGEVVQSQLLESLGILRATAVTAYPLSEQEQEKLRIRLGEMTHKTIRLTCREDPSLLGGIRLEMEGKVLDGSVKAKLQDLERSLSQITV